MQVGSKNLYIFVRAYFEWRRYIACLTNVMRVELPRLSYQANPVTFNNAVKEILTVQSVNRFRGVRMRFPPPPSSYWYLPRLVLFVSLFICKCCFYFNLNSEILLTDLYYTHISYCDHTENAVASALEISSTLPIRQIQHHFSTHRYIMFCQVLTFDRMLYADLILNHCTCSLTKKHQSTGFKLLVFL